MFAADPTPPSKLSASIAIREGKPLKTKQIMKQALN
jgi:hypothetical protein